MQFMMQMKDVLRELRSERDAKQSTIADELSISRGTYSSYENGITPPTETCIRIADYFGVSLEYLLGLSNERRPSSGKMAKLFMDLYRIAGANAPTATDLISVLEAADVYYQKGAPCGDVPLIVLNRFLDSLRGTLSAASAGNIPALLDSTNAAIVSVLDLNQMTVALCDTQNKPS